MVKMDKAKALKPGGHFSLSTQIYSSRPSGPITSIFSPEARARLRDANVEVDIGGHPSRQARRSGEGEGRKATRLDGAAPVDGVCSVWSTIRRAQPFAHDLASARPVPAHALYAMLLACSMFASGKKFFFVDHLIFSLTIHTFGFVLLMLRRARRRFSGRDGRLGPARIAAVYG